MKSLYSISTFLFMFRSLYTKLAISSYLFIPSLDQPPNLMFVFFYSIFIFNFYLFLYHCCYLKNRFIQFFLALFQQISQNLSMVNLPNASSDAVHWSENNVVHWLFVSYFFLPMIKYVIRLLRALSMIYLTSNTWSKMT